MFPFFTATVIPKIAGLPVKSFFYSIQERFFCRASILPAPEIKIAGVFYKRKAAHKPVSPDQVIQFTAFGYWRNCFPTAPLRSY